MGNNPIRYVDPDGRLTITDDGSYVFLPEVYSDGTTIYRTEDSLLYGKKIRYVYGLIIANDGTKIKVRYKPNRDICIGENSDCHGSTFTYGLFWIDNTEVEKILKGDGYKSVWTPSPGNIMIQRNENGDIIHSAEVIFFDRQSNQVLVKESMGNKVFADANGNVTKTRLFLYKINRLTDSFYIRPENVIVQEIPSYNRGDFYEIWDELNN